VRRWLARGAVALGCAAGGAALGAAALPSEEAEAPPAAVHRVELRAQYGPTGALADLRRIETWRFGDRARRRETVVGTGQVLETIWASGRITTWRQGPRPIVMRDRGGAAGAGDVDQRAARLHAALELGWMRPLGETRIGGREAQVIRARPSSPVERGWTVAVDPRDFAPLAAERRDGGRLLERTRLIVNERVPPSRAPLDRASLSRARSVPPGMTNHTRIKQALAALAVAGALGGAETANAAPRAKLHHWVIEEKAMNGDVGRTEGWQLGSQRRVLVNVPFSPWMPSCTPGKAQEWRLRDGRLTICGRDIPSRDRAKGEGPAAQIANPAEHGRVARDFIDRGAYDAAGEEMIGGRRVTVWREADRSGFEPEEERKLGLSTVYLDAADGDLVARRHEDVATGRTQEERVIVDEVLTATRARLARARLR
jgi:hypothetical protein